MSFFRREAWPRHHTTCVTTPRANCKKASTAVHPRKRPTTEKGRLLTRRWLRIRSGSQAKITTNPAARLRISARPILQRRAERAGGSTKERSTKAPRSHGGLRCRRPATALHRSPDNGFNRLLRKRHECRLWVNRRHHCG